MFAYSFSARILCLEMLRQLFHCEIIIPNRINFRGLGVKSLIMSNY